MFRKCIQTNLTTTCSGNEPNKQIQTHLHKRRRKHRGAVVAVVVAVAAAAVVVAVVAAVAVVTAAARAGACGEGRRRHHRHHRTPVFASTFVEVCLDLFSGAIPVRSGLVQSSIGISL